MGAVKETVDGFASLVSWINGLRDRSQSSLTQFTKKSNVWSRLYIEDKLLSNDKDIMLPLVGTLTQLYVSYVVTALNVDAYCVNGKTVRQVFETVASESFGNNVLVSFEDFGKDILDQDASRITNIRETSTEASIVNTEPDSQRLAAGRLIELDMQCPTAAGDKVNIVAFKVHIYVQLVPYVLTTQVTSGLMLANFTTALTDRWKAVKAGEISFWKDFVMARDIIERQKKTIKADKTGVVAELLSRQRNKLCSFALQLANVGITNRNLANAIMIVDKNTFKRACADGRVDFSNYSARQQFFFKTFTMIMVVVDMEYNVIEMFYSGIDMKGTYTFEMINKVGTKQAGLSMKDLMTAFSQGMSPKI